MTNELAAVPGQLVLSLDSFKDVLKKPLRLLPEAVRLPALRVWACNRHLAGLETPLALAARLTVWIQEHGLEPNDAAEVLDGLLTPDASAKHRFASDLMTDLAAAVRDCLRKRRKEREEAKRRAADAELVATPRAEVDRLLEGIGNMEAGA